MMRLAINIAGIAAIVGIAVAYGMQNLAGYDAFFLAFATVLVIAGLEFVSRANLHFVQAVKSIVTDPTSYGSQARYGLFVATVVTGLALSMGAALAG